MAPHERSFNLIITLLGILILFTLTACSREGEGGTIGTAANSQSGEITTAFTSIPSTPEPTPMPDLPVKVSEWVLAGDADGNLHLLGEILNESGAAVEGVTLTTVVQDSQGNSLLRAESGEPLVEEQFAPLVNTLENGESVPFDYPLPPGIETPAQTLVAVTTFQPAQSSAVPLQMVNVQWMTSSSGRAVLVGELVNTAAFPVRVENLASLARGADGKLVGAAVATLSPGLLMGQGDANQQDRAPFIIPFNITAQPDLLPEIFSFAFQVDALDGAPLAFDQNIEPYVDARGTFHLVSSVKNPTEQQMGALFIGGLYSASGAVMDASVLPLPVDLLPGEELPFDLTQFTLINQQPDYQAMLDHFTLQVDPSRLTALNQVRFELEDETMQAQPGADGQWVFTGAAVNTTGQSLQQIAVFAVLKRPSGTAAATSFTLLMNPAGTLDPGMSMAYSIEVMADPSLDPASLRPEVILTGINP